MVWLRQTAASSLLLSLSISGLFLAGGIEAQRRDRDRPDKNAPDCTELTDYEASPLAGIFRPPCRDPYGNGSGDDGSLSDDGNGGGGGSNAGPPPPPPPEDDEYANAPEDNELTASVYIGLQPWERSVGRDLTVTTARYFNDTLAPYMFTFGPRPKRERRQLRQSTAYARGLEERPRMRIVYDFTSSKVVEKKTDMWWWQYNVTYHCWWPDFFGHPVLNTTILSTARSQMEVQWKTGATSGQYLNVLRHHAKNSFIQMYVDLNGTGLPPNPPIYDGDGFTGGVVPPEPNFVADSNDTSTNSSDADDDDDDVVRPTFTVNLDTSIWDWRRYLGLGMFCFVFFGTTFLSSFAAYRQRSQSRKQNWGNLGTEKGVDQLLTLAWQVKSNGLQVYDKGSAGYEDGDSMLIGGFEQKAPVGSEIVITNPTATNSFSASSSQSQSLPPTSYEGTSSPDDEDHPASLVL